MRGLFVYLVWKSQIIEGLIYILRGQRVMLDRDLAELYGVPTKSINLAVKRNQIRFPEDFVLRLSAGEASNLKFQIETSRWGGRRKLPQAFTAEQGVAMLSSVLRSKRAALVNIGIMRPFSAPAKGAGFEQGPGGAHEEGREAPPDLTRAC